jgi:prepilin-type N-terminal cleavage/methylation domain-containing protein
MKAKFTSRRSAFTLLEVLLAVMILGMTAVGIFKFVQANLQAIRFSVLDTNEQVSVDRFVALLQEEMYSIPVRGQATLLGEALKTGGQDFDTMEWRSRGGPGLMTTAAKGEYKVQVMMRPLERGSSKNEIGFKRRPALLDTATGLIAGGSEKDATWVPLLQNVIGLRIRYWNPQLSQLQDSWREQQLRPPFMVVSILMEGETIPYEAVLTVPAAQALGQAGPRP